MSSMQDGSGFYYQRRANALKTHEALQQLDHEIILIGKERYKTDSIFEIFGVFGYTPTATRTVNATFWVERFRHISDIEGNIDSTVYSCKTPKGGKVKITVTYNNATVVLFTGPVVYNDSNERSAGKINNKWLEECEFRVYSVYEKPSAPEELIATAEVVKD